MGIFKWVAAWFSNWVAGTKIRLAARWAKQYGYRVVRLQQVGERVYLIDNKGVSHRVGRKG